MSTIRSEITGRATGAEALEPLAVSPRQACLLLSIGTTRLYELIEARELEAYYEGRARRITMRSIRERVTRLAAKAESPATIDRPLGAPSKNARTLVTS
jgi:excisionase family DNA binding protein